MEITLTITMTVDGKINITGIPNNKMVAYGMLGVAQEVISQYFKQAEKLVQPVNSMPGLQKID